MLEQLTAKLAEKIEGNNSLTSSVRFDLDVGDIVVDPNNSDKKVHNDGDVDTQCVINVTADDLDNMLEGNVEATNLFMMGKLKVSGDMSVAVQLSKLMNG